MAVDGAFLNQKVEALRRIGTALSMFGKVPEVEAKRRRSLVNDADLSLILLGMLDETSYPAQRAACALMLEYFVPGWRTGAPLAALGYIVTRDDPEMRKWRQAVLAADNWQCRSCGATDELEAHHVIPWSKSLPTRADPTNGAVLCGTCHRLHHSKDRTLQ